MRVGSLICLICKISNSYDNIFSLNIFQMSKHVGLSSFPHLFVCPDSPVDRDRSDSEDFLQHKHALKTGISLPCQTSDNLCNYEVNWESCLEFDLVWSVSLSGAQPSFSICLCSHVSHHNIEKSYITGSGGKPAEFYSQFSDPLPGSCLLRQPPLSVIDVTCPAACMYIAWTVQMSGFWLSSSPLPH